MAYVDRLEVITTTMELRVTGDQDSELLAVAVVQLQHSNSRAAGSSKLVSLRHFTRAEWDADPAGCVADDLALCLSPSVGLSHPLVAT